MEKEVKSKKNYNSIDILKFICSLFVVILHLATYAFEDMASGSAPPTGKDNPFLFLLPIAYTILRIAVPMFFVCSGFLLFKKINKVDLAEEKWGIVKKYCLRIFKLYLFWFVVSVPIMIDKHFIVATGDLKYKIIKFALRLIFLGGFDGAWYLVATIVSVLVVYWLSTKFKNWQILSISLLLYALAVLSGTYLHLFDGTFVGDVFNFLNITCGVSLYRTFFHGSLFIAIGKLFAENEELLNKKLSIILLCIVPILMYLELLITNYYGLNFATDCFFMLIPLSIVLFQFVLYCNPKERKYYIVLRNSSTFIYMFHFIFLYILYRLAKAFGWTIFYQSIPVIIAVYFTIIVVSIFLCLAIKKLSQKIKILKYMI